MKIILVFSVFIILILVAECVSGKIRDTSLTRKKRFALISPQRGVYLYQMVMGLGLPVALEDESVTFGLAFKSSYRLPTNVSHWTNPSDVFLASERTLHTRWSLYTQFADFLERFGYGDGKSCILRAICDVASAPFHHQTGIMGEFLHVLLTPSTTQEKVRDIFDHDYHAAERIGKEGRNCISVYPGCKSEFMDLFTRVLMPDMI